MGFTEFIREAFDGFAEDDDLVEDGRLSSEVGVELRASLTGGEFPDVTRGGEDVQRGAVVSPHRQGGRFAGCGGV